MNLIPIKDPLNYSADYLLPVQETATMQGVNPALTYCLFAVVAFGDNTLQPLIIKFASFC
jgi:hypothetical protein